jgi:hypothetical protein
VGKHRQPPQISLSTGLPAACHSFKPRFVPGASNRSTFGHCFRLQSLPLGHVAIAETLVFETGQSGAVILSPTSLVSHATIRRLTKRKPLFAGETQPLSPPATTTCVFCESGLRRIDTFTPYTRAIISAVSTSPAGPRAATCPRSSTSSRPQYSAARLRS